MPWVESVAGLQQALNSWVEVEAVRVHPSDGCSYSVFGFLFPKRVGDGPVTTAISFFLQTCGLVGNSVPMSLASLWNPALHP